MKDLVELQKKHFELINELKSEETIYNRKKDDLTKQAQEIARLIFLVEQGLHLDYVKLAESVIRIEGQMQSDNCFIIPDALKELSVNRGKAFKTGYFGVKIYSGFGPQRSDHPYGYGPNYGDIVFSIGLQKDVLDRDLTDDELGACIYYLRKLDYIQKAKRETQI